MKWEEFVKTHGKDYSDWFGKGNTLLDASNIVSLKKIEPIEVIEEDGRKTYMVCLVFKDEIIITGYDGNSNCHNFHFKR